MNREVVFYRSSNGRSPIEAFLDSLPASDARKAAWVLRLIEDLPTVPKQYFQKMKGTDDLWEVRVTSSGNAIRFFGFWDGDRLVVLSHAIQKKSQKTPRQAIQVAEQRKRDYFKRKEGHHE